MVPGSPERQVPLHCHLIPLKPKEGSVPFPPQGQGNRAASGSHRSPGSAHQQVGTRGEPAGCHLGETLTWAQGGPATIGWTTSPAALKAADRGERACSSNGGSYHERIRTDLRKCFSSRKKRKKKKVLCCRAAEWYCDLTLPTLSQAT